MENKEHRSPETGDPGETGGPQPEVSPEEAKKQALEEEAAILHQKFRNGVSWFYWIAGLSIVNSLMIMVADRAFIFGLGITQITDAVFAQAPNGMIISLVVPSMISNPFFSICCRSFWRLSFLLPGGIS